MNASGAYWVPETEEEKIVREKYEKTILYKWRHSKLYRRLCNIKWRIELIWRAITNPDSFD